MRSLIFGDDEGSNSYLKLIPFLKNHATVGRADKM
jgi:hypothetical protein